MCSDFNTDQTERMCVSKGFHLVCTKEMLLAITSNTKPSLQHPPSCGDFKGHTLAK